MKGRKKMRKWVCNIPDGGYFRHNGNDYQRVRASNGFVEAVAIKLRKGPPKRALSLPQLTTVEEITIPDRRVR